MGRQILLLLCVLVIALCVIAVPFPQGVTALAMVFVLAFLLIPLLRKFTDEKEFITSVFVTALVTRMLFGIIVEVFDLRQFFGPDAISYDRNGVGMVDIWLGRNAGAGSLLFQTDPASGAAWGMNYLTGFIYLLLGQNIFAAQSFCAVIGALTAPMVFFCSQKIFHNLRVSKFAAVSIALFPSFVIWSGQLLKDGLIIFLLVTAMTMVLVLQQKFNYAAVGLLIFSMFGILSLRFYIFYMVAVAVVGSFVIGFSTTTRSVLRNTVIMALVGIALTWLGVGRNAEIEYKIFANLDRVQSSRIDLAKAANSGFGQDTDVSTTGGAIAAVPVGFSYLMFAPFPWQADNLRQAITIPEVLAWWAMIPFLIIGLIYAVRNRLRSAFPILIFSLLLTLAYSIFQGNVGTAYRQRTQIQVFLFILIGVGWTVFQENRENKRLMRANAQRRVDQALKTRMLGAR